MTNDEAWLLREKYAGEETEAFLADCVRLKAGEPLAYVIGWVPFLGAKIWLDSHPLIPRPETEFWVEKSITKIRLFRGLTPKCTLVRVLDLCAGSGCIGVAVLTNVPNASVDFVEIDTEHHATISKNLVENGIDQSRAHIFSGDLFENVFERYDFILTNPPYIDSALDRTEESVRAHEPTGALYGGLRGVEFLERIVEDAPQYLTEHGTLYVEHEPEQVEEIRTLARAVGLTATTFPDQYGVARYSVLTRTGR